MNLHEDTPLARGTTGVSYLSACETGDGDTTAASSSRSTDLPAAGAGLSLFQQVSLKTYSSPEVCTVFMSILQKWGQGTENLGLALALASHERLSQEQAGCLVLEST